MVKNKTFIIAEIGINHNGDINLAKKLILSAKKAGADAVKFQKRDIESVYSKEFLESFRESPWGKTQRKQKEGLEFNLSEYKKLYSLCAKNNIEMFFSAWDFKSIDFISKFNIKYNKIASAMLIDENFLKKIAEMKKYTFISTGMSDLKTIKKAVKIFKKAKCKFELMHCVSTYPAQDNSLNLKAIQTLSDKFNCNVGYSGHETGVVTSVAAVAMGATSIERHITLDRTMYGSDQSASLEIRGFTEMVSQIRKIELALGNGKRDKVSKDEKLIAKKLREHIK